ncbi:MAG TPA: anti-anti-sigma factor, partial [Pseudomonas sp.]|nr:anti-anti-sigma factor [Pseudomonas sp.]
LEVNCAAVEKSSSVGLALLLAFMRDAEQGGKTVKLTHLPLDMQKIAEVCGLTEILNIAP